MQDLEKDTPKDHILLCYKDSQSLIKTLTVYAHQRLKRGEALIFFVTEKHRAAFQAQLSPNSQLMMLDASEVLSQFMEGDLPDAQLFKASMDRIIREVPVEYSKIRIYGEMTNLLWEAGNFSGAMALEELCSEFAKKQDLTLLCCHAKIGVNNPSQEIFFHRLCNAHTHVVPDEEYIGKSAQLQMLNTLQHKASALEKARSREDNLIKFIADLSHDLRNLLHGIYGNTELLEKNVESLRSASNIMEMQTILDEMFDETYSIKTCVDEQAEILNANIDMAKLKSGQLEFTPTKISFKSELKNIVDSLKSIARRKGIALELELPEKDINGKGYPVVIKRIVTNLVANALKFTPEHKEGRVKVALLQGERRGSKTEIEIAVTDTGPGLSEIEVKKLGKRFVRKDMETAVGAGLGLSISIELADFIAGKIIMKSKEGVGSTFSVVFPCSNLLSPDLKVQAHGEHTVLQSKQSFFSKKKVLIVDDNKGGRLMLKKWLEEEGYVCCTGQNGVEAVTSHKAFKPDIVLMDIHMPEMDGVEAIKNIRQQEIDLALSSLPIIITSGNSQTVEGANDFLTKPMTKENVLRKITYWLNAKMLLLTDKDSIAPVTLVMDSKQDGQIVSKIM